MNYGKLILASCTLGPLGFAIGAGAAFLFRFDTPSLYGAAAGVLLVFFAMRGGSNGTGECIANTRTDRSKFTEADTDMENIEVTKTTPVAGDVEYDPFRHNEI